MKVYCFYEPVNVFINNQISSDERMIDYWKKSWSFYGWEPVVLSLKDLKKDEIYKSVLDRVLTFPTTNHLEFEVYSYLRWLCMTERGGWFSDFDVINYGFKPAAYGNSVVSTRESLGGSVVYGPKNFYKKIINMFLQVNPDLEKDHISDMLILDNCFLADAALKVEKVKYDKNSLLQHYAVSEYGHMERADTVYEDERFKKIIC